MRKQIQFLSLLLSAFFICLTSYAGDARKDKKTYPEKHWMQYKDVSEAGWNKNLINDAAMYADSLNSAAFMLIEDGVVVKAYGDVSRRYMCHSVRKSLLSALYGIYEGKGKIDINKTMAELEIDDKDTLTEQEKQAKISDLLKARSGIYHPAAYETPQMASSRPTRGSHEPGTFWYYNNWDFNTLGYIFIQETGEDIFEAFHKELALPLAMEDYNPRHGYYHMEAEHSNFPAYPFRMSARDLARLGLLYERGGKWNGKQIMPSEWIRESVVSYGEVQNGVGADYGYMWWILDDGFEEYGGGYTALGVGGQTITVLPGQDIVFVHRTDTYTTTRIPSERVMGLLKKLLAAKTGKEKRNVELIAMEENQHKNEHNIPAELIREYCGSYPFKSGYAVNISNAGGKLRLMDPNYGNFNLIAVSDTAFLMEDALKPVYFLQTGDSILFISEHIINAEAYHLMRSGRVKDAVAFFELNTRYYPNSFNAFDSMGEAYLADGDTANATESYRRSLELNPHNIQAMWMLLQAGIDGYAEIKLEEDVMKRYEGTYLFQRQIIDMQVFGNNLHLISPQGERGLRLIPLSENEFMMDGGQHFKFVFKPTEENKYEFDLITRNGNAGKGVRVQ